MRELALYAQLLKLSAPWWVMSVTLDKFEKAVIVRVGVRATCIGANQCVHHSRYLPFPTESTPAA